jgi:GMP synthase-like glutamine amidotransferase
MLTQLCGADPGRRRRAGTCTSAARAGTRRTGTKTHQFRADPETPLWSWPTMSTCLVVQHMPAESAWALEDAVRRASVGLDVRQTFVGDMVPADAARSNGVIVMGGPMSAASDEGFSSRGAELALLTDALARGVPTLGVCLGAQLLALAAGGRVFPGESGPEIGWDPVELTKASRADPLFCGLPDRLDVLHWHGDTFSLPPRATRLAANRRYANQAFRVGPAAWGIQFHLEVTQPAVDGFVSAFSSDLAVGAAEQIRRATPGALRALVPSRDLLFDRFAALVAQHAGGGGCPADFPET